ncbi:hypothetical protein [Streptomyces sp. NPDC057253]|uniref:hypothetical protein n=1 Tax=Streptomyces sp. NPDC057253 TaxID=3346069 RepID=UPI003627F842
MDKRTDPVEIIARVGGVKAGWQVVEADGFAADADRGEIGAVDMGGIRYVIRLGPQVRRLLYEVVDGRMLKRDVLAVAAWPRIGTPRKTTETKTETEELGRTTTKGPAVNSGALRHRAR